MTDTVYRWELEELKEEIDFLKSEIKKLKKKNQNEN